MSEDTKVKDIAAAFGGALMVCVKLARYRDEVEGTTRWRDELIGQLIEEAKNTQLDGFPIDHEPEVYECIFGGIRAGLAHYEESSA